MIHKNLLYCAALLVTTSLTFAASLEGIEHFGGSPIKTTLLHADRKTKTSKMQISEAKLLSADGQVVIASALNKQGMWEFYRWTKENGVEGLGLFHNRGAYIFPRAISDDGSVLSGDFNIPNEMGTFVWTKATGPRKLMNQAGSTNLLAMSGDGEYFFGEYSAEGGSLTLPDGAKKYYMFSPVKGFHLLPDIPSDSALELFSIDGRVMVFTFDDFFTKEVTLVQMDKGDEGFQEIKELKNKIVVPKDISKDGHAFTGHIYQNKRDIAFRWSQSKGLEFIGGKDRYSYPEAISSDGNTIVGQAEMKQGKKSEGSRAFVWTSETGMVFLKDRLDSLGVDTQGWVLESAVAVSADGKVILGNGENPAGEKTGFIVHL